MRFAPETIVFGYACLIGVGLGIVYDLFRMLRLLTGGNTIAVFVEDLLFAMIASGITFWICLTSCSGWIRGFVIVGEGLGFLIYHFTIGELMIRIFRIVLRVLQWMLRGVWKRILYPPIRFVLCIVHKILNLISRLLQKFKKICFSHNFSLQLPRKILYNKHNKQADVGREGGNQI